MRNSLLRVLLSFLSVSFLMAVATASDTPKRNPVSTQVDKGKIVLTNETQPRPGSTGAISVKKRVFDKTHLEKSARLLKERSRQLQMWKQKKQASLRAKRARSARRLAKLREANKIKIFGRPTRFTRAPSVPRSPRHSRSSGTFSSNLLLNGRSLDTISVGDPIDMTFSFAPGNISAILSIYCDADSNGVVSGGDLLAEGDILLLDNDDNDIDPATGTCKVEFRGDDVISDISGNLIFELDNHQTVSTAMVTVQPKATPAFIIGTVTPPLPNLAVYAFRSTNSSVDYRVVLTDSAGKYQLSVPPNAQHELEIYVRDITGVSNGYILPNEKPLYVIRDTVRVDFKLKVANSFIEGYAKDQNGASVKHLMLDAVGPEGEVLTHTDSSGFFRFGVMPGSWEIRSEENIPTPYLRSVWPLANLVVTANETVDANVVIPIANSSISGHVMLGSAGIGGMIIEAEDDSLYTATLSAGDGSYSVPVYKPSVGESAYTMYGEFNSTGYTMPVSVIDSILPGSTDVNFGLMKVTGGVKGVITDVGTGKAVPNADIYFYGSQEELILVSDDSGYFHTSLLDGPYEVAVDAIPYFTYDENNYAISGAVRTKDIALQRSGSFSGTVTDKSGKKLRDAYIYAADTSGRWGSVAIMEGDTSYLVGGIGTGKYLAVAELNGYVTQWYNNVSSPAMAQPFRVTSGFDTPNINFTLSRGGSISGTVVDFAGKPVPNVEMWATDSLSDYSIAMTDDSGHYQITGLVTARYLVSATSSDYLWEWYNGAFSSDEATQISVVINKDTPNINFALSVGASISGIVRDKHGIAISGAMVSVMDSTFALIADTFADEKGNYTLGQLPAGRRLYLLASAYGFADRWYGNVSSPDSALPIILLEGENRSGVNFAMLPEGAISGVVRDQGGSSIPYALVTVQDLAGSAYYSALADAVGQYAMTSLNDGKYFVSVTRSGYRPQWYNHKSALRTADSVAVTADHTTANIDFSLVPENSARVDSFYAKIRLSHLPDSVAFSQPYVPDNSVDYRWSIWFDGDGDPNTGTMGCEVELALTHAKAHGDLPFYSTILDGTVHGLWYWDSANVAEWRHDDISVRLDPADKNTLLLRAPKTWPELKSMTGSTKFFASTYYCSQAGPYTDQTIVSQSGSVGDATSDVPYVFVDIVSASWGTVTEAISTAGEQPTTYALWQNYPNPFNPSTTIEFDLPRQSYVSLKVYNVLGQEVASLVDGDRPAGRYRQVWQASGAASGIYFYRLRTDLYSETRKMLLMK
ncbi:MAG TPA: carboxypeptidase regulatory-like domain-containing protein [Bacteroidota bacterium]|nr:carboxypeptidase regulatory-like domain-containing protein [Bacteroidota bacterium]